jgi:hypothetical protein
MNTRRWGLVAVIALALAAGTMTATADPISGRWEGKFDAMGQLVPFTMTLKLTGDTVTGTLESEHTGHGEAKDGKWKDGTMTMTMVFEQHQSIVFSGKPTDDGLAGEFKTEGFSAKWTATKAKD